MSNHHIHISNEWIRNNLTYSDLFSSLSEALSDYSNDSKEICQPARNNTPLPHVQGYLRCMPSYVGRKNALAVKLLTDFSTNQTRPQLQGCIVLFDGSEGQVLATLDAEEITAMRTAAVSAIAYRALYQRRYKQPLNSQVLTIIGTGVQSRAHICAFIELTNTWKEIRIVGRTIEKANLVCLEMENSVKKHCPQANLQAFTNLTKAVDKSNVIVLATSSNQPIINSQYSSIWSSNCILISVGACRLDQREIDCDLLSNASIWVDSCQSAVAESGDIQYARDQVHGEIGQLLSTDFNDDAIQFKHLHETNVIPVIKTLGLAIEDAVSARIVYDKYIL